MNTIELWTALHEHPELSGQESTTIGILQNYLRQESDLELHDEPGWFWGIHRESKAGKTVAVRADMDAILNSEGKPFHGCGHDGHMSMAAAAAASLKGKRIGRNVLFLFQPAEETGQGGKACAEVLQKLPVDWIAGCHNIPGQPLGTVLLRPGTFACASKGLIIRLEGRQSHAAYPELGVSPVPAAARLLEQLPGILQAPGYAQPVLATVIDVHIGEKNFGISAGSGEICLTIRARENEDLKLLQQRIEDSARAKAQADGVKVHFAEQDAFPATVNAPETVAKLDPYLRAQGFAVRTLAEPMRWSEDFGWYLLKKPGFFFGLGAGENQAGLHTEDYVFPEELLQKGIAVWNAVIRF